MHKLTATYPGTQTQEQKLMLKPRAILRPQNLRNTHRPRHRTEQADTYSNPQTLTDIHIQHASTIALPGDSSPSLHAQGGGSD